MEMEMPWTKEQLERAHMKLCGKNKALQMDKEDMYHLATRAKWEKSDWEEFVTIFNKNK
ncbi:hypothetical protein P8825_14990 [Shouchella clausii]|uniref:hypothetical protein n=1 Tax=Shouchella clausii TaxID=79880 RepID=UPI002DB71C00|nr:hypothetical protein [Shouchella clausii]MEB5480870.1 hypothetical protein [Shouchella clausii]